jgi:hypothetical protein
MPLLADYAVCRVQYIPRNDRLLICIQSIENMAGILFLSDSSGLSQTETKEGALHVIVIPSNRSQESVGVRLLFISH